MSSREANHVFFLFILPFFLGVTGGRNGWVLLRWISRRSSHSILTNQDPWEWEIEMLLRNNDTWWERPPPQRTKRRPCCKPKQLTWVLSLASVSSDNNPDSCWKLSTVNNISYILVMELEPSLHLSANCLGRTRICFLYNCLQLCTIGYPFLRGWRGGDRASKAKVDGGGGFKTPHTYYSVVSLGVFWGGGYLRVNVFRIVWERQRALLGYAGNALWYWHASWTVYIQILSAFVCKSRGIPWLRPVFA